MSPETYLVGYSVIDMEGMTAYLRDSGNEDFLVSIEAARKGGLSDGEILCSAMAKLCYKSLTLGQNKNVTRVRDIPDNVRGCFDAGHLSVFEHVWINFITTNCSRVLCYHPDTEVFAEEGWQRITDLRPGDSLLTMSASTRQAHWKPIQSMHSFDYEGRLHGWATSECVSPLMTPDHLLWAAKHDLRRARGLTALENVNQFAEKVPFSELIGKQFSIQNHVVKDDDWYEDTITVGGKQYDAYKLFAWLGWMATDGSISKDRPNQLTISQSKQENLLGIHKLMDDLFLNRWRRHGPYAPSDLMAFTIIDKDLAEFTRQHIGVDKSSRKFSRWVLDADRTLLSSFFDAAVSGDGTKNKKTGHVTLYCPGREAAGQWQYIVCKLGQSANLRVDDRVGHSRILNDKEIVNRQVMYQIEVDRRGGASLIRKRHQLSQFYSGKVFCPKTEDGLIFVRGIGQPFWSGNTHELVRHRIGSAFSQTSRRYVRGDSVDIVFDPILEPVREEVTLLQHKIEVVYGQMVLKMGLDEMKDFDRKKKITSALRRLLPNGQSNEIGFSLNLRSVRHTVQMRTSRHAEWEIRLVFNQVYNLLKDCYPLLFHGATEEMVDGAVEVSGMRMQPYDKV